VETLSGRYRLIERLGAGGMSVVWLGHDEVLGRQVAVKLLTPELAGDDEFRDRIHREARAVARLSHPNIANVYDFGEAADGRPYVVMELVDGRSLADVLASGRMPWPVALRIAANVADALAAAHARGLVHRDITPANVMLAPDGAKVVDFGIAAIAGEHGGPVIGTPAYLAPEQLAGAPAQPATDVYALGIVLYQMLCGRPPWRPGVVGPDRVPAPLPAIPGMPPEVASLMAACLQTVPARRPPSAMVKRQLAGIAARFPTADGYAAPVGPGSGQGGGSGGATQTMTRAMPVRSGTRVMRRPPAAPVPRKSGRTRQLVTALVVLGLLIGGGLWYAHTHRAGLPGGLAAKSSPSPSPSPTPSVKCTVAYKVTSDWLVGFTASVDIQNTGNKAVAGWTVKFTFPDSQKVVTGWNGRFTQTDHTVTVKDVVYNAAVEPGKSMSFSFIATYTNKNNSKPQTFSLNDIACH
jgi:serine/threonine-protein kinase